MIRNFTRLRFSTASTTTVRDFLDKSNMYFGPQQDQAVLSAQQMLNLLLPTFEAAVPGVSPFLTRVSMDRKLNHWDTLAAASTSSSSPPNVPSSPTLNHRGIHFFGESKEDHENVAAALSHCIANHLPADKVHRTTLNEFMVFVRTQLHAWQTLRRDDMMTPDVTQINVDGGDSDPIVPCSDAISNHCWVLQLDKWDVASVTDAMLMRRVFTRLFNAGTFVVSSGNVPVDHFNATELQEKKYNETRLLFQRRIYQSKIVR
jgi:hypothetical protein